MTRAPIAIIGRSCRLPGADSIDAFWRLLVERRCSVRAIDDTRWSTERFLSRRKSEPGKSYTFAAGVLDDVWGFDPAAFSISPREAEQMDPQQRLALQLVWEACEDAALPPSRLARTETGVFVGASALDYGSRGIYDPAGIDPYFATGNTLSIISNRISYAFDLRGPSFTLDTACSSSLVALHEAALAIATGRIDTAIVVGVNVLASPVAFVGFAQASMLSPHGRCCAFGAGADGYVRAEGGVALILRAEQAARTAGNTVHARVLGSGVNSDGRTVGMSFPSAEAQASLLRRVYDEAGIAPESLAFVEAHGTGTRVGDPVEAEAVGRALGTRRREPLFIGSVKTNVGHLEAASGLVGVLKATLALERGVLPASLHVETLNPDIPFDALNLRVATEPVPLRRDAAPRSAGVNSFGFGGTNAHVIVADPEHQPAAPQPAVDGTAHGTPILALSARSREAVLALAGAYGVMLADKPAATAARVASSVAVARDLLSHRLVVDASDPASWAARLAAASRGATEDVLLDTALGRDLPVAFVYSGNGAQWAGMGLAAERADASFRAALADIDVRFRARAGWSLREALASADLAARLRRAEIGQPLLLAVQIAMTAALRERGVVPAAVLGHSVGEVAAAHAAGALTLEEAVEVIYSRSRHQETAWNAGTMAAVLMPVEEAHQLIIEGGFDQVEIAAVNSARSLTVAGPVPQIRAMATLARKRRVAMRLLEVDYPFHTALVEPVRAPLSADLHTLAPHESSVPFVSSVTGTVLPGRELDAGYWWRNVRQPVRFADAMAAAIQDGFRLFVEIGPRPVLQTYVDDALETAGVMGGVVSCDDHSVRAGSDPIRQALARIVAKGGAVDAERVFGRIDGRPDPLPTYRWQNRPFSVAPSIEMLDAFGRRGKAHPLVGTRPRLDGSEWFAHLDAGAVPYLGDHVVGGRVVVAGAALAEMALAAGREWLGSAAVELLDFEILRALVLEPDSLVEVTTRLSPDSRVVEILSRSRLRDEPRTLHAFGRIGVIPTQDVPAAPEQAPTVSADDVPGMYRRAQVQGLEYGPAFQVVERIEILADGRRRLTLRSQDASALSEDRYGFHPPTLDGCFHGLIPVMADAAAAASAPVGLAYLPVRFGEVRLYRPSAPVRTALLTVTRVSERSILAGFTLLGEDGRVVGTLDGCRFRATLLQRRAPLDRIAYHYAPELLSASLGEPEPAAPSALPEKGAAESARDERASASRGEDELLLEAFAVALAHEALADLAGRRRRIDVGELEESRRLASSSVALVRQLLTLLEEHGHASVEKASWTIARKTGLPRARDILRTVVWDHPVRAAEAVIAARAAALLPRALREGVEVVSTTDTRALLHFESASAAARGLTRTVLSVVDGLMAEWPAGRPLRILELGAGSGVLTRRLAERLGDERMSLTATDPDEVAAERLRFAFGGAVRTAWLDLTAPDLPAFGRFDLVVSASPLGRAVRDNASLQRLPRLVADGGTIVLATLAPGGFARVVLGLMSGWFARPGAAETPLPFLRSARDWKIDLRDSRLADVDVALLGGADGQALRVVAAARQHARPAIETPPRESPGRVVLLVGESQRESQLVSLLTGDLEASGRPVQVVLDVTAQRGNGRRAASGWGDAASLPADAMNAGTRESPVDVVVPVASASLWSSPGAAVTAQAGRILGVARALVNRPSRLWIVTRGALQGIAEAGRDSPTDAALAGFVRVLTNEARDLDLRLVDVDPDLDDPLAAVELSRAIRNPSDEREVIVSRSGVRAPRLRRGIPGLATAAAHPVARLSIGPEGGIDALSWTRVASQSPQAGEVAIDVLATGLNFRDVMWALGLLPEEALEDGFAGPTFGIECAGVVTAIGAGVRDLEVGARVMAFAAHAFSSRVVVPSTVAARLPDGVSLEAGATIPVAFLTAYYALHQLARLSRGEWCLIHGGAGGVGLAALQIARWRGARTIATAGSDEKRDFLRVLGADHVLSSRSLDFVDEIRGLTGGDGVDVVLNSLAGDAMERSLGIVRPFGRFVELGKRDYFANSRLGLRPFRRNVSYFGVDADQLLAHRQLLTKRLFRDLVRLFHDGALTPLPFRTFASDEVRDAFRLMQHSQHVGKVVVRPPPVTGIDERSRAVFSAAADGSHVVVGGLGGFGLATASWLIEHGARHLVLVGRQGVHTDEARSEVSRLEGLGATIMVAACDVSDESALARLLDEVARTMPLVKGVIHAAMVLDDALLSNLDEARFASVLRPKIEGAANLDRLTRGAPLDYFVLFSSATTVVGNPGQANYVAANAYLESLARLRRGEGLPALAVAWGAIEDVGYLARQHEVRDKLSRRLGQAGTTAREALDALGRMLAETDGGRRGTAVLIAAPIEWAAARRELALLASPVYEHVVSDAGSAAAGDGGDRIDLVALVTGRDPQAAREAVVEILAAEASRILRLPVKEIGAQRSLTELGMDSLMGLELRLGIERRFGIDLPLPSISETTTLASMAAALVARIQETSAAADGIEGAEEVDVDLARRHVAEEVTADDIAGIGAAIRARDSEIGGIVQ